MPAQNALNPARLVQRKRGLARHAEPSTIKITIDPARRKLYEKLVAEMHGARREEAGGFDAYWEAVGDILDRELYVSGGYETALDFIAAVIKEPKRTVARNVRIARHASPAEEAKYGPALLDAAIGYAEAASGGPPGAKVPIRFEALRIPVQNGNVTEKRLLVDVTVADVLKATRKLLDKDGKSRVKRSVNEEKIKSALAGIASLAPVTVSVSDGKLRLGNIPLAALGLLVRALSGVKLASPGDAAAAAPPKKPARSPRR